MSDQGSVFDMASKKAKEEKAVEEKAASIESFKPFEKNEDIAKAFEKYKKLHEDIKNRIETEYKEANISQEKVREFIDATNELPEADQNRIKQVKQENQRKLKNLLPKKGESKKDLVQKKEKKKGVVKKGWMPMR